MCSKFPPKYNMATRVRQVSKVKGVLINVALQTIPWRVDVHTKDQDAKEIPVLLPLRIGNVIFGYTIILISIAVVAYHLLELGLCFVARKEDDVKNHERFKNFDKLEDIFGKNDSLRHTDDFHLVDVVILTYYLSYVVIGFLLLLFGIFLTCGAHKANHCLVSTFFVYSFLHLFFTIELVIFEALSAGWIQLGLILLSDLLLIICLFSVKYLMEAIRAGNIYSRPGHVYNKY